MHEQGSIRLLRRQALHLAHAALCQPAVLVAHRFCFYGEVCLAVSEYFSKFKSNEI